MTLDEWKASCVRLERVGSRVTCDPPPLDTDEDWLVLVNHVGHACEFLESQGYQTTTDHNYEALGVKSPFVSYKEGDQNILVTGSSDFFSHFMVASSVAKKLNLLSKTDRVMIFQAILYRIAPESSQNPDDGILF